MLPDTAMPAAVQFLLQERTRRTTIIFRSLVDHQPREERMTFQAGPRAADTPGLCGARTRQPDHPPCRNFGMRPSGRCRLHGGRSLRGIASRTFVHGRYCRDWLLRFHGDEWSQDFAPRSPTTVETTKCATPPKSYDQTPHATEDTPCTMSDSRDKRGDQGGTEDAALPLRPDLEWAVWLAEASVGPPKTRQQRGLPPTPEELGRAAAWCAQDRETDVAIARRLGIGRRTLARWKQRPEFRAALAALQERRAADAKPLESDTTER